jgi:hypothetical protein
MYFGLKSYGINQDTNVRSCSIRPDNKQEKTAPAPNFKTKLGIASAYSVKTTVRAAGTWILKIHIGTGASIKTGLEPKESTILV